MYSSQLINTLIGSGVAVARTDTLYGILARADSESAVRQVYEIKGRDGNKPPIVLIGDYKQLFDDPDEYTLSIVETVWPGAVSVILPSLSAPAWIKRGGDTVAYRMPANKELRDLLLKTGPLVAPSANPQDEEPARSVRQAEEYFGDKVDCYEDGGEVDNTDPSKLIRILPNGEIQRLR